MNRCPYCGCRTARELSCRACSDVAALDPYVQAGKREPTAGDLERIAPTNAPASSSAGSLHRTWDGGREFWPFERSPDR